MDQIPLAYEDGNLWHGTIVILGRIIMAIELL